MLTIIIGDFSAFVSAIDKWSRQKINKNIDMKSINQLDIIDVYRTLHATTVDYTIFSNVHRNVLS